MANGLLVLHSLALHKKKTPRARGGQRWRPDSSCWSWRRLTWPRKRAQSESVLTAQTKAHLRPSAGTLPEHWPELRLWHGLCVQQKTPSGVAAPPITTTAKAVYYNPLRGFSNFNPIFDSFVKPKPNTRLPCRDRPLPTSSSLTFLTVSQM
eukprot:scaffold2885_cov93-Isochrysis_galbana.AAC.1